MPKITYRPYDNPPPAEHTYYRTKPKHVRLLREAALDVANGDDDAANVARQAVSIGMLLIGTTVPKRRHYPVSRHQHRYHDLGDRQEKQFVQDETKMLEAGTNVDVALLCGLFGDYNDEKQRIARCVPILGTDEPLRIGWGADIYKTFREGLVDGEEGHVRPHARAKLINAALDTRNPLTGYIECVYDDPRFERISHEIGQVMGPIIRETIVRIPLIGYHDLPKDMIATDYKDVSDQAIVPPGSV